MPNPSEEASLAEQKVAARKAAGRLRAEVHARMAEDVAAAMAACGLDFLGSVTSGVVSGFYPHRTEIDLRPLLERLCREGWTTCLPIVRGAGIPLGFKAWKPGDDTEPGAWNIPVPASSAPDVEPDTMLVPLLAFDRSGFRLGYGGGFYDRTIDGLRRRRDLVTIGIAFSVQEVAQVVRGPYDQPLDWILTERGPIEIAARSS